MNGALSTSTEAEGRSGMNPYREQRGIMITPARGLLLLAFCACARLYSSSISNDGSSVRELKAGFEAAVGGGDLTGRRRGAPRHTRGVSAAAAAAAAAANAEVAVVQGVAPPPGGASAVAGATGVSAAADGASGVSPSSPSQYTASADPEKLYYQLAGRPRPPAWAPPSPTERTAAELEQALFVEQRLTAAGLESSGAAAEAEDVAAAAAAPAHGVAALPVVPTWVVGSDGRPLLRGTGGVTEGESAGMCARVLRFERKMQKEMHLGQVFALERRDALLLAARERGGTRAQAPAPAQALALPLRAKHPRRVKLACVIEPFLNSYCHGVGIVPFIAASLTMIEMCERLGAVPTVSWAGCPDEFCPPSNGTNFFHWFFQPINEGVELLADETLCLGSPQAIDEPVAVQGMSADRPDTLARYLKLETSLAAEIDAISAPFAGKRVLGVHVRGTDKREAFSESGEMIEFCERDPNTGKNINCAQADGREPPLSLGDWVRAAEKQFAVMPSPKLIFVASDSWESIHTFKWYFGAENVVSADAPRNKGYADTCCSRVGQGAAFAKSQGRGALKDIFLLARCDAMMHTGSSWPGLIEQINPKLKTSGVTVHNVYKTGHLKDDIAMWDKRATELKTARPGHVPTAADKAEQNALAQKMGARKDAREKVEMAPVKKAMQRCLGGEAARSPQGQRALDELEQDDDMVCLLKLGGFSQCRGMRDGNIFGWRSPWMAERLQRQSKLLAQQHVAPIVLRDAKDEWALRCYEEMRNRNCFDPAHCFHGGKAIAGAKLASVSDDCSKCARQFERFLGPEGCKFSGTVAADDKCDIRHLCKMSN